VLPGTTSKVDNVRFRSAARWLAFGTGVAAGTYGAYVGLTWLRYGHGKRPTNTKDADGLLDLFIPEYEVAERHHVSIAAPPDITFAAACDMDLLDSRVVRAIFRGRELLLGAQPEENRLPRGLLAQTEALGWRVLAQIPGREIVMGAVTQPWKGDVRFQGVAPDEFAAFHEPDYVKIAWTLRADSAGAEKSVFRTETRVVCTDAAARTKFRRYWSFLSPGIILIRRLSLGPLKKAAEQRARQARSEREAALTL
jgi:hypothetical protein